MIAILGAGVMGETFIAGLLASGTAASEIVMSEKHAARAAEMSAKYRVPVREPAAAAAEADVILIVVKPLDVAPLLALISGDVRPGTIVVSLAAGITLADLHRGLGAGVVCMRAMPNTPALVGAGMTVLSVDANASAADEARIKVLLDSVGETACLPEELQDAVTAISGSGPAYVFAFMEALETAGVEMGLPAGVCRKLVQQTVYGASKLAMESETDPGELRRRVTSPGGTTQAALTEFNAGGFGDLIDRAAHAARDRSQELGSAGQRG